MEYIDVIKCGQTVVINDTDIKATVIQVCISFNKVEYNLGYMFNGTYTTIWLPFCMFKLDKKLKKQSIGFK